KSKKIVNQLFEEGEISNQAKNRFARLIEEEEESDSLIIKSVSVIKVNNSDLQSEISSSGRVVSLNKIGISSEVSGKLEGDFSIKKGTKFRKGDVLFKIKNTDVKLLADARKSNFMNLISSNLADIKLDFPSEYVKWNAFFKSISFNSYIENLPETSTSKEKNFIISKGIISEYLSIKSDEERLKKYIVRANFDGVIIKSYTDIGANVNMGSPVIDIISNGNMEVELTVNSTEFTFIDKGSKVILIDKDSLHKFEGTIIRKLDNFINKNTQNMSVFVSINNNTDFLYDGMYLDAIIYSSIINNACKIPRRAVFEDNKVFIVNTENQLEIFDINIISNQENNVISDNIINNTMVVIEPLIDTKAGIIVNPIIK
ncbi:MAG TPA: HlyD family efflux transporter periplasmic adaptor subunit, partial [Flavobacteriales bacterium]|nr:HlyD family efflux transporter periplasmic adaptor subunit [Flavobacteriales bacterium]